MTTYYVRKTGSDLNTGLSPAAAFLTIQKAINTLVSGAHVVYVGAGIYEEEILVNKSGQSNSNRLRIVADTLGNFTGDFGSVVIDGNVCFNFQTPEQFVTIENFTCRNFSNAVLCENTPDDIVFFKFDFEESENSSKVVHLDNAGAIYFYRNVFHINTSVGIYLNQVTSFELLNNTFISNADSQVQYLYINKNIPVNSKNNLAIKEAGDAVTFVRFAHDSFVSNFVSDYNDFYGIDILFSTPLENFAFLKEWQKRTSKDVNSFSKPPLLRPDDSPSSKSPLVNAGSASVPFSFVGSAPDIGALEYWDGTFPRIYNNSPYENESGVLLSPVISFDIDDQINGIKIESLTVNISDPLGVLTTAIQNGEIQQGFSGSIVVDGSVFHVYLFPELQFTYGQTVNIEISVQDNLGNTAWLIYSFDVIATSSQQLIVDRSVYDVDIIQTTNFGRYDLRTSSVGQVQAVKGRNALVNQLIRAVLTRVNSIRFATVSKTDVAASLIEILRKFRTRQINFEYQNNYQLKGYEIYRLFPDKFRYIRINETLATDTFVDINLENGIEYSYQVVPIYENTNSRVAVISVVSTPSAFSKNHKFTVLTNFVVRPGNSQIEFYFRTNRYFLANGLLEEANSVNVQQSQDPRGLIVNMQLTTYGQEPVLIDRTFFTE